MGPNALLGIIFGVLALVLPRRRAFGAILAAGTYTTYGDPLDLGGLSFYSIRVVIVLTLVRVIVRSELNRTRFKAFDALFLAWLIATSLLYVTFDGSYINFSERLGYLGDVGGLYIVVRALVRNADDLAETVTILGLLLIPLAVLFAIEWVTGQNPFAALGGVDTWSIVRNGRVRAQGPFKHSILAGTFAAAAFPMLVGLSVFRRDCKALPVAGALSAAAIVAMTNSSGPLSAFIIGIIGLGMWWIRAYMRLVRRTLLGMIIALAVVMKAPVWFLIDRLSELTGGDGWYRSELINSAVNHFSEWWLIGTGYTAHWMATGIPASPYSADIVNEFVNQAVRGGILCLALFIIIIVRSFSAMGAAAKAPSTTLRQRFFYWAMGCSLAAHIASFFSVTYFDQTIALYYLVIGTTVVASTLGVNRRQQGGFRRGLACPGLPRLSGTVIHPR